MIIIFDLGVVIIVALVFIFLIAGGIMAAFDYLMANLLAVIIVMALIGLVIGFVMGLINENKAECIPSALTFPVVVLFPIFVIIPIFTQTFADYHIGDFFIAVLKAFVALIIWMIMAFVGILSIRGFGDIGDSDDRSFIGTVIAGIIGCAIEVGVTFLAYYLLV